MELGESENTGNPGKSQSIERDEILEIAIRWRTAVEKLETVDGKLPSKYLEDSLLAWRDKVIVAELQKVPNHTSVNLYVRNRISALKPSDKEPAE